jgi:diaminohydroxyphosphoribosylaminopyrimidine deaminase/5-amino-6-(5-phosphoribosylamino)uracil reductase
MARDRKATAAGIEVTVGVLEKECQWLNRRFFTRVQKQRPYIILKWAQTADGFFAPADGSQHWITGPEARKLVHQWRAEEDAILVGKNTVLADNPQLKRALRRRQIAKAGGDRPPAGIVKL